MTELHIERKDRTLWPWILAGLLLLALVLWVLFGRGDGRADGGVALDASPAAVTDSAAGTVATAMGADGVPAPVGEFLRFAETRTERDASHAHEYTADGLRRLAGALGAVTDGAAVPGVDVQQRLSEIRQRADALQRDPASTEHALQAREAFVMASALMEQMQQARFSGLASQVREVSDAATAIRPDQPLLRQAGEVQRFFERSANAVREMARTT